MAVTRNNTRAQLEAIWEVLGMAREDLIPEGAPIYDEQWNDVCTAMAWIAEDLGIDMTDTPVEGD